MRDVRRLGPGDEALARTTFALMAAVFAEDEPVDETTSARSSPATPSGPWSLSMTAR